MSKEKGLPLTSNHWGTYRAKVEDGKVKISVPCTWPKQSVSNVGFPGLLDIRVQEGLFWILEQEGWIHPYTAVWEADLPVN